MRTYVHYNPTERERMLNSLKNTIEHVIREFLIHNRLEAWTGTANDIANLIKEKRGIDYSSKMVSKCIKNKIGISPYKICSTYWLFDENNQEWYNESKSKRGVLCGTYFLFTAKRLLGYDKWKNAKKSGFFHKFNQYPPNIKL